MGAAMATTDVKVILGITTTNNDTQIAALLYPSAAFADEYCNYGLSHYLYHRDDYLVDLRATSTAPAMITNVTGSSTYTTTQTAPYQWLSRDTVKVWSTDDAKLYEEDRDYEIDYENGYIYPLAASTYGTSTGGNVLIDFAYIDLAGNRKPAQIAISQIVWADINIKPGIASESAGPLSRSYTQDGIPSQATRILKPFRRPVMK
ncbi:MAG: hypothetical protein WC406_05885 [Methanoregula sp.]